MSHLSGCVSRSTNQSRASRGALALNVSATGTEAGEENGEFFLFYDLSRCSETTARVFEIDLRHASCRGTPAREYGQKRQAFTASFCAHIWKIDHVGNFTSCCDYLRAIEIARSKRERIAHGLLACFAEQDIRARCGNQAHHDFVMFPPSTPSHGPPMIALGGGTSFLSCILRISCAWPVRGFILESWASTAAVSQFISLSERRKSRWHRSCGLDAPTSVGHTSQHKSFL